MFSFFPITIKYSYKKIFYQSARKTTIGISVVTHRFGAFLKMNHQINQIPITTILFETNVNHFVSNFSTMIVVNTVLSYRCLIIFYFAFWVCNSSLIFNPCQKSVTVIDGSHCKVYTNSILIWIFLSKLPALLFQSTASRE